LYVGGCLTRATHGHQEHDALTLSEFDRDEIEGDDSSGLAGFTSPDGAYFLRTGADVPTFGVMAGDPGEGEPVHRQV